MNGVLALLQSWLAAAERLAGRFPELAAAVTRGAWPAAVLSLALGFALLVAGLRLGRILAAVAAAALGWAVVSRLVHGVELWNLPAATPAFAAALVLGVLTLGVPELYPVLLGAVPGALLGAQVAVAGKAWLGGVAGAIVLALLALWLRRLVLAATAAGVGAVLVLAALVSLSGRLPRLAPLVHRPYLLLAAAGLLTVAGTAYQLGASRRVRPRWGQGGQPLRD